MIFEDEKIEGLIAQRRLAEASAALTFGHAERRVRAGFYALAGDDRALARVVDPELLACGSGADVAAYYVATGLEPSAGDRLVAGAVLAWSGDADGTHASLRDAYDRAVSEGRFPLAVAARERLAHHALLFGDVELARGSIEEAIALASDHRFSSWLLRCLAVAASLALDGGDLEAAAQLLARGHAVAGSSDERALFAATGAQLAVERGDDAALRSWSGTETLETALHCELPEATSSATIAALIGGGVPAAGTGPAVALRRALLQAGNASAVPELFSIAARYGSLDEAQLAVNALAGVVAASRPYLHAHHLLARAHLLFRSGERIGCVDCAGDAARAFTAMGLRRWTNEAMRMLVSQAPAAERRQRGRPTGTALTEREEQIAHLIRRGARNREVAIALQISEHTVERHVSSILGRLGLRSRWQIADPQPANDH